MKSASAASVLSLVAHALASNVLLPRDFRANDYYVVHLDAETSPNVVARTLGLAHEGEFPNLAGHHLFAAKRADHDVVKRGLAEKRKRKRWLGDRDALDGVLFSQKQKLRAPWEKRILPAAIGPRPLNPARRDDKPEAAALERQTFVANALGISDPIFKDQWHLFNPYQLGHDVNVTDVWLQGVTGKNATVAIVDDGLDMYSDDLKDNYYAKGSYDFNDKTDEPKPRLSDDRHGTRCAGEVSAVKNNVCGVGVAYNSKIAGLRILSKLISDADEALAMNYDFHNNHIYSCSWGPPDDGQSMDAPGLLIRRAMLNAVQKGRSGLGSIYVFASGNGAANEDNCNFDGYTNSIYSITVGAIDRKGKHPYYSEKCSAGLVVTYSSGSGDAIHTTDVGQNACYDGHGGTSAAAPLAAGIFALVLEVRPDLSWRDMQYLAMDTAVPINEDDGDWQTTTIGKRFSHTYGYGKVDSYGIVEAARSWELVKPQAWYYSPWIHVNQPIPQGDQGVTVSFDVTKSMLKDANLVRLEHVTVTMNVKHSRRGDLSVDLTSPNNVVSHLSVTRKLDGESSGYDDWTFMSVVHWGETGVGTWTIMVKDTVVNEHNGTFTDWHLKLWGECRDASKAKLLPMPTEEDDNDHALVSTTTIAASTTSLAPNPAPTGGDEKPTATPSNHPDRPVNGKPTDTAATSPTDDELTSPSQTGTSTWLPSFLPTFGVSASTQAWIYGALGLIVAFCCGLGVYLWTARRRRLRNANPRNDYEFELLDEAEAEALAGGGEKVVGPGGVGATGGARGGGARRTRGGELYDAFAGGSDEDDDNDDDDDDDFGGARAYRDNAADEGAAAHGTGGARGELSEKRGLRRDEEVDDGSDEDEHLHHVVGDDSEDEDEDADEGEGRRPRGDQRRS